MSESDIQAPPMTAAAAERMSRYRRDGVREVSRAIGEHDVVVVGMAWNPHVRKARRALDAAGVAYTYLGYGSYVSMWRERLAIKLWSGWPTFPQVFVRGTLVGGASDLASMLADGSLRGLLEERARA